MKSSRSTLIAFLLVISCSGVRAEDAHASKHAFEKLYAELKAAMGQRDDKAILALLAPGFESEDVSGKVESAEQMLADLSNVPKDANRKSQTTLLTVNATAKVATVTQRYHMTKIKTVPGGKSTSSELTAVSTDTWQRIGGAWRMSHTVTRQMDYAVNGQTLVHKSHK